MTPEVNQRVAQLRAKAAAGTMTEADMAEAIEILRAGRVGAAAASDGARRKTAKAVIPDADSLLDELGGV